MIRTFSEFPDASPAMIVVHSLVLVSPSLRFVSHSLLCDSVSFTCVRRPFDPSHVFLLVFGFVFLCWSCPGCSFAMGWLESTISWVRG